MRSRRASGLFEVEGLELPDIALLRLIANDSRILRARAKFRPNRVENLPAGAILLPDLERFAEQLGIFPMQRVDKAAHRLVVRLRLTRSRCIEIKELDFAFQPGLHHGLAQEHE